MVVLVLAVAHSTSAMLLALAMRPDSPTAPEELLGPAVIVSQLECAVKVCVEMSNHVLIER